MPPNKTVLLPPCTELASQFTCPDKATHQATLYKPRALLTCHLTQTMHPSDMPLYTSHVPFWQATWHSRHPWEIRAHSVFPLACHMDPHGGFRPNSLQVPLSSTPRVSAARPMANNDAGPWALHQGLLDRRASGLFPHGVSIVSDRDSFNQLQLECMILFIAGI